MEERVYGVASLYTCRKRVYVPGANQNWKTQIINQEPDNKSLNLKLRIRSTELGV